jgi:hypothetical protein
MAEEYEEIKRRAFVAAAKAAGTLIRKEELKRHALTADELYEISGDQEKLFKSANILPFVYRAFRDIEEKGLLPFKIEREEI